MAKVIMLHESRSIVWDGGECHQSHGNNLKDSDGARLSKRMKMTWREFGKTKKVIIRW